MGGCLGRRAPATQGTGRCLLSSAGVLSLLESGEGYGRKSPLTSCASEAQCWSGSLSCVRCGPWILLLSLSLLGVLSGLTVGGSLLRSEEHSWCFLGVLLGWGRKDKGVPGLGGGGLAGAPCPVPAPSPRSLSVGPEATLEPEAFALSGHRLSAICLTFLLRETWLEGFL